ncbi:cytochrome o ubiquinol oxidase subunit IV [Acidovorax sp. SUPP3334]|uniref:cytochrome o ubiquinol oxidase subunit IV n=1 Tax=Acidovorax sp. SUPP3334 TaxID=2920881 RepID=UPI0023DE684F|nr:cytochrome o ubiquinol oxidase subunit IV [Acidovorax sp. SUPP3334]GKT24775.1 cytochrome o ubiquinol oxidase subunit IV [Acidovorax sp. SUPP3334]
MSTPHDHKNLTHTHDGQHGHDDHHGHHDEEEGASHGSMRDYVIGFVASVILTAIPFWLVMGKVFDKSSTTALVILGFAAVQIVVHMVYFLHMNTKSEGGWNMLALVFTVVLVVITLAGSLWVMFHLNANMMPMSIHDMKNMP